MKFNDIFVTGRISSTLIQLAREFSKTPIKLLKGGGSVRVSYRVRYEPEPEPEPPFSPICPISFHFSSPIDITGSTNTNPFALEDMVESHILCITCIPTIGRDGGSDIYAFHASDLGTDLKSFIRPVSAH
jgi:hypothetical protein